MEILLLIGVIIPIVSLITWRRVSGLEYMHTNYPEYNGEDLFDENVINKK
jgi:hypothetical protein